MPDRRAAVRLALALAVGAALIVAAACDGGGDDGGEAAPRSRIVYEANVDNVVNVYTVDAATHETAQLTADPKFSGHPSFSPDRKRVLFVSDRDGQENFDIYTMPAAGGAVRRVTDTPDADEIAPKYSPDGEQITMAMNIEGKWWLGLMDADGGEVESIAGPYVYVEFPTWTRDGEAIFYSAQETSRPDADIYSINLETRETKLEVRNAGSDVCPHFTYDGAILTFAAPAPEDPRNMEIWAIEWPGGEQRRLTNSPGKDDYSNPNPDNDGIVFVSERDGNPELYLMGVDGSDQRRLLETPDVRENVPDW
jgi:Tol biopolymer transport system component